MTDMNEYAPSLTRTQRRFLCRVFNGRSSPIIADGQPFLTYKDASRHLLTLEPDAREAVYEAIKQQAKDGHDRRG